MDDQPMANKVPQQRTLRRIFQAALVGAVFGAWWSALHHGTPDHPAPHNFHDVMASFDRVGFSRGLLISVVFLVVFSIYWEIAAAKKAENRSAESPFSRGIHLVVLTLGQVFLVFPVPGLRARFLPDSTLLMLIGLCVEALGVGSAIWARHALGRNWNAAVAVKVDHELVRSGPYQYVRHPIYTGVLLLYAGIMVVVGEIHSAIGLALICLAYWRKIRQEEQVMSDVFGANYADYRKTTKAVIPGLL